MIISCDIMENKIYFVKNNTCKRIIKVFDESEEEALTTQEIINALCDQRTKTGKLYSNEFSKGTITQTLNKYPYFIKMGLKTVKSITGNTMKVNTWSLTEVETNG